jgi:cytidylate kinase
MSLITISQGIGCDGNEIARKVSESLQIELYDDSKLKEEARRTGLHSEQLKAFDEKAPGYFDRMLSRKPEVYVDLMIAVVYEVARRGEGVIIGHGSQVLLHDFSCALHVLIYADVASRTATLMRRMGLTTEVAEKLIHKSDSEKRGFFQFAFQKEWNDPALYDICLNPEKVGIEQSAQLIIATARNPKIKSCSLYALDAMERLSQTKKIEAALLENGISNATIRVDVPEKGVAHITGAVYNPADQQRLPDLIKRVPGISEARVDVFVAPRQ